MKKTYTPFLFLILLLLASCGSRHLATKGIKDITSNYVVTSEGQHINAATAKLQKGLVITDTATYRLTSLSAVKIGSAYYGVKDGALYDGVYYGKLMLLRKYGGTLYDFNSHRSSPVYFAYLQKEGKPEIVNLDNKNLIAYVQDNPLALRKAKAARIFGTTNWIALAAVSGLLAVFLPYENPIRKPAVTVGLIAMPTYLITLPIAPHKRIKAVKVYNR